MSPWRKLCLVLVPLAAGAFAEDAHLRKGLELFQQERYQEALDQFEQARRQDPRNAAIENALGIAATKLGRLDSANQHYAAAIRLNPKLAGAHRNLAVNLLAARNYEEAEHHLKAALAIEPADPFVHFYLATLYLATSRDPDAVAQLPAAGSVLANDPAIALQMAKACIRLGRTEDALALIGRVDQRAKLPAREESELGALLYSKGQFALAVDRLRRAAAAEPAAWAHRYNLAMGLLAAHENAEAVSLLEKVAAERPADANVLSLLGSAYEAGGSLSQALDAYQKAVRADPENANRYLDYSRVLMDLDRYDESEEFVRQGMAKVPDTYALNVRLGSVQTMAAKYDEARVSFQKAVDAHPEIPVAYGGLARTYFKEARYEDAVKVLETARARVPQDFAIEYYYGLALARLNRYEEAAVAFGRAVPLNPSAPEPRYELGKCDLALERLDAAKAQFEEVIRLNPRHANAYYQLSRIYARGGDAGKAREFATRTRELKQELRQEGLAAQKARLKDFKGEQKP